MLFLYTKNKARDLISRSEYIDVLIFTVIKCQYIEYYNDGGVIMGNLSRQKRQQMLDFLETLRKQHIDDESIRAFAEIENHIRDKKYGLVWEKHAEKVDEELIGNIPIFTENVEKKISKVDNKSYNFILEGDNLQSLYLLEKTHNGAIDMIYIDPPYNTGEQDFVYDDNYVDANDAYRHSKWLSFMSERLMIARRLLAPNGFIFISIDDKEAAPLRLLCDEIFGESNYEKTDYIQVRYPEKTLKSDMKYHKEIEQVLVYKRTELAKPYIKPEEYNYDKFIYSVEELTDGREMELGGKKVIIFEKGEYRIVKHPVGFRDGLKEVWATGTILNGNSSGRFFRDYLDGRKNEDGLGVMYKVYDIGDDQYDYRYFTGPQRSNATKGKYYQGVPVDKMEDGSQKVTPIPNFYDMAGDFGNIRHEGGVAFNSGKKPVKMIKRYLEYFEDKDIVVLDFFAGSGSTGQAVMDLNKEDGGNRSFILCTNNEVSEKKQIAYFIEKGYMPSQPRKGTKKEKEWKRAWDYFKCTQEYDAEIASEEYQSLGICHSITYPRIRTVITGKRPDGSDYSEGRLENLKYFKCEWTPRKPEEYLLSNALCLHIREMIELKYGIEVDNIKNVLILNKTDFRKTVLNREISDNIENIWVNQNIIFNSEELEKLNSYEYKYIPEEFFGQELKEAAE